MQKRIAIAMGIACVALGAAQVSTAPTDQMVMRREGVKWQPMPHEWADGPPPPPGAKKPPEVALIWGDPTKSGMPFIFWMRPAERGATVPVPPHWHPTDENITVLSGVFCVGEGDKYSEKACKDMPAGSYIEVPKAMHHFAVSKNATIQVYGIGPYKINWVR
jgi:hypothetical protein